MGVNHGSGSTAVGRQGAIARLLACRYGDGAVYLPRDRSPALLEDARAAGFVSPDGYLTRKGRQWLAARGGL